MIISPHEVNSTPIIAQRKQSTFIELFNNTFISYHFCRPAQALSLNYIPLVGTLKYTKPFYSKKEGKAYLLKDILVPILPFQLILGSSMKIFTLRAYRRKDIY